jgi:hypothetical protein
MQRVVSAQAGCAVNALGGVTRTVLKRTDHNAKYVILQVRAEIDAGTTLAKHTLPGVESVYIFQGGFEEFAIQGQPSIAPEAGDGFNRRGGHAARRQDRAAADQDPRYLRGREG